MRNLSIRQIIGLFIFGMIGFLIFLFGVGFIHRAWTFLVVYIETGITPLALGLLGIAMLHDLGIFLATLGITVLYVILYAWLLPLGNPSRTRRGFQYILGFLLVFTAWVGIWIFMHRAFLFQLEYWRGYLPEPTWPLGIIQLQPATLHLLGLIFIGLFLIGTLLVILYKAYRLFVMERAQLRTSFLSSEVSVSNDAVLRKVSWPLPFVQIRNDWKFYFIAFIPYFSAAFAVWILLFEGFLAKLFGIPLIWALLPWIVWIPGYYLVIGGIVLLGSMLALWAIIVFVRRAPVREGYADSWWWKGARRYLFVLLTLIVILSLTVGLLVIFGAYTSLDALLISTALILYQIGEVAVIIGLITAFFIIVGERASES